MTTTPPYEPYREVPAGTFRWRLGVRPLDLADWLVITDHYDDEVTAKARIMAGHPVTAPFGTLRVTKHRHPSARRFNSGV